jgi:hypothetical protein
MKNKTYKTSIFSIISFFVISSGLISCTEEVNLKLDDGFTRIVVEGDFSTDTTKHIVKLRTTSSYFYSQNPPVVSGASVNITDGTQIFNLTEIPSGSGNYYTDSTIYGLIGKNYTLNINNVDIDKNGKNESYKADGYIFPKWQIDSIRAFYKENEDGTPGYEIRGYGVEPGEHNDYYLWNYYINGKLGSDSLYKTFIADDRFFNGVVMPGVPIFEFIEAKEGDTIIVETNSISQDYYKFTFALISEALIGGGFMGPPANVPSNVDGGAMGYFKTSAKTRNTTIIPKKKK